jgi:hypothetical protein
LLDTIDKHGGDRIAQALAMDELVAEHVAPFYEDQAVIDHVRLATLRHAIFGARPPQPPPVSSDRVGYAQLRAAASSDPTAFRAFWKINGMICLPEDVYTDPRVVACTREALRYYGSGPSMAQPARDQLLAALAS